jgi:tetratricopeptide (TPR) repeat protein
MQHPGLDRVLLLPLAQVALLRGKLDVARRAAEACLAQERPPVLAHVALALARTYQGEGREARDQLTEVEASTIDPLDRGTLTICRAFSAWIDDEQALAEEQMRETVARFREVPGAVRASVFASGIMAEILSQRGRFDEAQEYLDRTEAAAGDRVDPRLAIYLRCLRASCRHQRGERVDLVEELESLRREFEAAGYVLGRLWAEALLLRTSYALGRRARAEQIYAEAMACAEAHGVVTAKQHLIRARDEDPLRAMQAVCVPRSTRGHAVRDRVLAALVESAGGDRRKVDALLASVPGSIDGRGYALDRAIVMLARGNEPEAKREAAREQADPDLMDEIAKTLPTIAFQVIVDGRRHQIRANGAIVSLGKRRAVRQILYRLASRPNRIVSRDELAYALWTRSYDPLAHENALKSNISNLRKLIELAALQVEADASGYRLIVPDRFLFVPESSP